MLSLKAFLHEGGNIKVGPKGSEVSAAPFPISHTTRAERRTDIHHTLSSLHNAFHKEHGEHLFGQDKEHLKSRHVYSGSTADLMSHHISDQEFAKHKPHVGDVDVQVSKEHKEKLASTLQAGKKFGKYTVVGTKKHGNEISAVMRHENGEHHQFDFEGVHHPGSETERFLHSSNWEDTKAGIKGAHHKMLINAVAGSTHKFSISHGLRSRSDENDVGVQHPTEVSKKLFGKEANHANIHSFHGVVDLIKAHKSPAEQQEIYNKFKSSVSQNTKMDSAKALEHMRKHLNVSDETNESLIEGEEHHATVVPLMGVSPFSHMGHAHDIGGKMKSLPGKKVVGLSSKADVFSPEERKHIMSRQWQHKDTEYHVTKSGGDTVGHAYHSLPKTGKKVLHILVGSDRKEFAHGLKDALENGRIKEMNGHKWDAIHVHTPEDEGRSHGMSGTKMRAAIAKGDTETFKKHLGPMFDDKEAKTIMDRSRVGILSGKIKLKR